MEEKYENLKKKYTVLLKVHTIFDILATSADH